jgi:predicted GTPase
LLVTTNATSGNLTFHRKSFMKWIQSVPRPRAFAALAGPTGVGKSSIINAIAGREMVPVCSGPQPCSTGVDMVAVPNAKRKGGALVLLDVEGLGFGSRDAYAGELALALCMSTAPVMLVDTALTDITVQRAAHLATLLLSTLQTFGTQVRQPRHRHKQG